ncbi:protein disulfide-isomerase A3-like protein [Lates japonicus]|uniref:Protein disulfide-isomerase A3-like protein n=1 Tax=Lates japonicus TaxID=270547 RepID=A0AAD3NK73_LATJO|nr:protein disulfide-isomerase A3-like protein [Lates japonicus]
MAVAVRLLPAVTLALLSGFLGAGSSRRDVLELGDSDFDYLATEHETMLSLRWTVTWLLRACHCSISPSQKIFSGRGSPLDGGMQYMSGWAVQTQSTEAETLAPSSQHFWRHVSLGGLFVLYDHIQIP